jgi:hypothetical protein
MHFTCSTHARYTHLHTQSTDKASWNYIDQCTHWKTAVAIKQVSQIIRLSHESLQTACWVHAGCPMSYGLHRCTVQHTNCSIKLPAVSPTWHNKVNSIVTCSLLFPCVWSNTALLVGQQAEGSKTVALPVFFPCLKFQHLWIQCSN